jgi:hypothetical protein
VIRGGRNGARIGDAGDDFSGGRSDAACASLAPAEDREQKAPRVGFLSAVTLHQARMWRRVYPTGTTLEGAPITAPIIHRRSFARACTAIALGGQRASDILRANWRDDANAEPVSRAVTSALDTRLRI